MLSKILLYKQHIKASAWYLGASLLVAFISIAVNPLMAMNLSPDDYAIIGYYTAFNMLITPFVSFYLIHYYTKKYFELSDQEREKLKSVILVSLVFFSLLLAAISLGAIFLYTTLFNTNSKIPFFPYAFISILSLPLTGVFTLILVDYRMQRKGRAFFLLSVVNGSLGLILSVLFVVVFKWGALGKLGSLLASNFFVFCYCLYLRKSLFRIKFDKVIFRNALKFCYPLVIAAMLSFFSSGYDRIALEKLGNITELGFYVVGVQIAGYLTIFSTSINDTFQPDIFQSIVQRNFRKCVKIIILKVLFVSVIVLFFIVLAPVIIDILTAGRYIVSTKYAVIIAISTITSVLYHSLSQVTIALGYTYITLINKVIVSCICVLMYTELISRWGAIGASWGTVLSFLLFFLGNLILIFLKVKKIRIENE